MATKHFVVELQGGPASGRRTVEALELAAALAQHGHTVSLLLHTATLAHLNSARGDDELREQLQALPEAGLTSAWAAMAEAPESVGPLSVQTADADALRADADAVVAL